MKAKDLMVPVYGYLSPDETILDASDKIKNTKRNEERIGVRALPVLDENKKLVGIVSMGDILKAVMPKYLDVMHLGDFTWDGMVEDLAAKVCAKKVSEIMIKEVVTVKEDSSLMSCIDHMIHDNSKRLPVVNADGQVVGMLYERDVFYAVTKNMDQCRIDPNER